MLVLNKPSAAAPASLEALTKAWNSSPLATFRPRQAFTRPVGWRRPCPLFSRLGTTWSSPRSRRLVQGLVGLQRGLDHIAPPLTSPRMGHRPGASPKPYQRRPVSTPVTTCRNRPQTRVAFCRTAGREWVDCSHCCFCLCVLLQKYNVNVWVCLPVAVAEFLMSTFPECSLERHVRSFASETKSLFAERGLHPQRPCIKYYSQLMINSH